MISEFIAYLQANIAPNVQYAFTANPLEDVDINEESLPQVYVYPGDYGPQESEIDNYVRQVVEEEVACLLVCRIEDYETQRDEIRAAALGWTHDENYDAFELSGGEVLGMVSGAIFVRETYVTRHIITQGG